MDASRIKQGLTLVELLVVISITAILAGVTIFMLSASLDAYFFAQEQISLDKALDDCLNEISGGGLEAYGIKDGLEILEVSPESITFVPFWVDDTHIAKPEHSNKQLFNTIPFTLNRPFQAGAALPICEAISPADQAVSLVPITFILGERAEPGKTTDEVLLNAPVPAASRIQFIYQPDAGHFSDCAMSIKWEAGKVIRRYNNKTEAIPKYNIPAVALTGLKFQYFDNTNTEVQPLPENIPDITAVRVTAAAAFAQGKSKKERSASVFINLRNTRTAGAGLIIRKGTKVKIPDSRHIRIFSLGNIAGMKRPGLIELEARPKKGTVWKMVVELAFDKDKPIIKKYSVEYPPGEPRYSEIVNLGADQPLNFMNLGNGRFDYDFDKNTSNMVNLEGDVELVVTRMEASGAALFIRP